METRATTIQPAPVNSQISTCNFTRQSDHSLELQSGNRAYASGRSLECLLLLLAVALAFSSARAQQDIDLTGYTLVFEDNFDTLSVADTDDKGDAHLVLLASVWAGGRASRASDWATSTMECRNGVLINRAVWNRRPPRAEQW